MSMTALERAKLKLGLTFIVATSAPFIPDKIAIFFFAFSVTLLYVTIQAEQ